MYVHAIAREFRVPSHRYGNWPQEISKSNFRIGDEADLKDYGFPPEVPAEALGKIFFKERLCPGKFQGIPRDIYGAGFGGCFLVGEVVSYLEEDSCPTRAQLMLLIGKQRRVSALAKKLFTFDGASLLDSREFVDSRGHKFQAVPELCGDLDGRKNFSRFRKYLAEFGVVQT